ncbi:MAG: histidine phosphatase family protein [Pseudomonadota bacterium]
MRELILFRHAKSSWTDLSLDDHDRPLNARGRQAAPTMGAFMRENAITPDLILCSTSVRTRETLALAFPGPEEKRSPVIFTEEIYEAPPGVLMACVQTVDDSVRSLMVLGHNPGSQMLALQLAATGEGDALRRLSGKFPTAAMARIMFEAESWRDIPNARGHLAQFITPKQLA